MTLRADSPATNRRRTVARVVNLGTVYALCAVLAAAMFLMRAPGVSIVAVTVASLAVAFLFDPEDELDRMFWTQIAHGLRARALMRKPIKRLPDDPCPPQLLAAVRRFDQHANPLLVAEVGEEKLAVLDWTTWDQPDRDYYCLIAVDVSGAINAMTFFSKWPKAWGSLR